MVNPSLLMTGCLYFSQLLLLRAKAVVSGDLFLVKNALGGAFKDTPTVGCQKEQHSWAVMSANRPTIGIMRVAWNGCWASRLWNLRCPNTGYATQHRHGNTCHQKINHLRWRFLFKKKSPESVQVSFHCVLKINLNMWFGKWQPGLCSFQFRIF